MKRTLLSILICFAVFACEKQPEITTVTEEERQPPATDFELLEESKLVVMDESLFDMVRENRENENTIMMTANVDMSSRTINYFSIEDYDTSNLVISDNGDPLVIEDYGPRGQLPIEMRRPTIYVQFNKPMVPLSKLGEPLTSSQIMTIEPKVEGVYRWYGTSLLSFQPDEPLLKSRQFTVTIHKNHRSLSGAEIKDDFQFSFFSEPLQMVNFFFGSQDEPFYGTQNIPPGKAESIIVNFNQPVDPDLIREALRITDGRKDFPFTLSTVETELALDRNYLSRSVQISVDEQLPFNRSIKIVLPAGSRPMEGTPPTPENQEMSFRTLSPFQFSYMSFSESFPYDPEGAQNPVYFIFSQPLTQDDISASITTSFGETIDITDHLQVFHNKIRLKNLPVTYESTFTVTFATSLKDSYGQTLATEKTVEVEVPPAASYASLPGNNTWDMKKENRMLEAQFDPYLVYSFQNLDGGTFRVQEQRQDIDYTSFERNTAHFELVDLGPYLNSSGFGIVNLKWDLIRKYRNWRDEWKTDHIQQNLDVQVTDMGLTVRYGYNRILVWVNSLTTGEPIDNAEILIQDYSGNNKKRTFTNSEGLAIIPMDSHYYSRNLTSENGNPEFIVEAVYGDDTATFRVKNNHYSYRFGIYSRDVSDAEDSIQRTFLFSDRGLYKPGETVTFRGIDWNQQMGQFTPFTGNYSITLKEQGYNGKTLLSSNGTCSSSGGFTGTFTLPDNIEPAYYILEYSRNHTRETFSETIQVANFRRLNFQVNINSPSRTYVRGDEINLPLRASYLSGGTMSGTPVTYFWTRKPVNFRPPGDQWKRWVFGPSDWGYEKHISSEQGTLDTLGMISLTVATGAEEIKGMAYRYIVEATVEDIDRQTVSARQSVLCHPADFYIGSRITSNTASSYWSRFVKAGNPVSVELALVDKNGDPVSRNGEMDIEILRGYYNIVQQQGVSDYINTRYEWVEDVVETDSIKIRNGSGELEFTPENSGSYRIRTILADQNGREALTELQLYASGGNWIRWASNNAGDINLIVDQDIYNPGDTARILVQSPLPEGRYLLTIEREGIVDEKIITLDSSTTVLEIPIEENYLPVMYVSLCSFQPRTSTPSAYGEPDFGKPKGLFGVCALYVSTTSRQLEVEVATDRGIYRPGEEATAYIKVTRNGRPVPNAEVTYLAVDRGVLDIINYHIPDPILYFYDAANFQLYVQGDDSRRLLLDPVTYNIYNLVGGDGDESKLERRDDFSPLAVFEPYLKTDANGLAEVTFTLPDTLTTYRATAIALDGNNLGHLESEILVQNPVNVRAALPRRLRVRDTAIAGCVVHNIDTVEHEVTVSVRSDLIHIAGETEKTVTVPPSGIYEVPFILEGLQPGEAEVVFTIRSDAVNEELVQTVVVEQPIIREAFTTTGRVAGEEELQEEGLVIPSMIGEGYGSLSIQLDSTLLPFVQTPITGLVSGFYADTLPEKGFRAMSALMFPDETGRILGLNDRRTQKLISDYFDAAAYLQHSDGGLASSSESRRFSSFYTSLQGAMILGLAEKTGYQGDIEIDRNKLLRYLKNKYPECSLYSKARILYLRTLLGEEPLDELETLAKEKDALGISGYAFIVLSYLEMGDEDSARKIYARMKNFVMIGTQTVDIVETYEARDYFDSGYQQLAQMLQIAVLLNDSDDLIFKLANSLNPDKSARHWMNNDDRIWIITALWQLSKTESREDTRYTADIRIDSETVAEHDFRGTGTSATEDVFSLWQSPLGDLERDELHSLVFAKDGEGTLYYTSTISYALPFEVAKARDEGLCIFQQIEKMDGTIVTDGNLELGETYRCRIVISTTKARSNVLLHVPVPSGAEIVDPSFNTSSSYFDQGDSSSHSWRRENQYGDENTYVGEGYIYDWNIYWLKPDTFIGDNAVNYSWQSIYRGSREVSFIFRTTTPGIYPTPPATAELMFEPEVFGRSDGQLYVIK